MFKIVSIHLLLIGILSSCQNLKPVIQVDDKYNNYGLSMVKYYVDICQEEANDRIDSSVKEEVFNESAMSFTESLSKTASQAILNQGSFKNNLYNNSIQSSARSTQAGIGAYKRNKLDPTKAKKNYIAGCLAQKGLVVIGWQ